MDVPVFCLLSLRLFSLITLGSFAQHTPIEEEILDSTSERSLEWISEPTKAWQETNMKLGLDSVHSVYQGCNQKFKNQIKTLWTKWIPRKEAHELQLDLLFAQDDQVPVIIYVQESDEPVDRPGLGQMRSETVAPQAFSQVTGLEDVVKRLHHAWGLHLGKISQKGFHLGFSYRGSCMLISTVRVFYMKCPGFTEKQTSFRTVPAGSGWTTGQCVDGAEAVSAPKIECQSDGQWSVMQGSCACGAGYQTERNMCKACPFGSYKPVNDSGVCQNCPPHSRTYSKGASVCDCDHGFARLPDDPPQLSCMRSPTVPLNLNVRRPSNTALILKWDAPADLGGAEEVTYNVECSEMTEDSSDQWGPCDNTTVIIPEPRQMTETLVNITGMKPHANYNFSIIALNRISVKLGTDNSLKYLTVWRTPAKAPPHPVPTAAHQQHRAPPLIAGVLCGVLLLVVLISAAFCFVRCGYKKLRTEPGEEFIPLSNSATTFRRHVELQIVSPQQVPSSVQVLDNVSERLLCGIRDVLVDRSRVTLGKELGKGEFGAVYEGVYSPQDGESSRVAVKTMKVGIYDQDDLQSFLKEAEIMQHFDHENVVKLLGVTLETEQDSSIPVPLVILPFLKHGDLRRFLIATRYGDIPMFVPHQSLLRFMVDIATGMEYLSSKGFLHRDLAARNCMLGDDLRVRVADFGLSKQICSGNYYRQKVAIKLPIKWMAMESLSESVYTTKSDVWSFGVTMWEIVSRGRTPYPGIPNHELLEMLEHGHRLKQGECDSKLYEVMLSCWHKEPSQRPCFAELAQKLKALLCELPPLEPSKESYYINQGLEAANTTQSSAAASDFEDAMGNIYTSCPKQNEEMEMDMKDGYLLCDKSADQERTAA